jgi:hypothetical protein
VIFYLGLELRLFPFSGAGRFHIVVMVHEAMPVVQGLLPGEQIDRFRIRLNRFTESAVDTWKRIQRIRKKLEPDFDTTVYEEMRWQTLKLDGGTVNNSEGVGVNNIEDTSGVRLVVFPRLYVVDDTKTVANPTGVVLEKSQCEGAQREMDETQPGQPHYWKTSGCGSLGGDFRETTRSP